MSTWNDLLIRDSLLDTGITPSPGYPYAAPDVICTQQTTYANPTQQLGTPASYAQDPNIPLITSQNNFFYLRASNLGTQDQGGQAYLYWTASSLTLIPGSWFNRPILTSVGGRWQPNNPLPPVAQNGISVTQQPFAWTPPTIGTNDHFCVVGAVGTSLHPWPPPQAPSFRNWDAFILWVRNNQNICARNLTLVQNPNAPQWDRVDGLFNAWSEDKGLLVGARCVNVPVGTMVTLRSTALGIDKTEPITNGTSQWIYAGANFPGGFNGFIETSAVLPSGARWPAGALIQTVASITIQTQSPAAAFAFDFGEDAGHPEVRKALQLAGGADDAVLVEIGNCTTTYAG